MIAFTIAFGKDRSLANRPKRDRSKTEGDLKPWQLSEFTMNRTAGALPHSSSLVSNSDLESPERHLTVRAMLWLRRSAN